MTRLFGTDGVRGLANDLLTPALAVQLGEAAARVLTRETPASKRSAPLESSSTTPSARVWPPRASTSPASASCPPRPSPT